MDRNNYNTKQRDEIVEFFSRHRGSCFTAKDIITSGEVTVGEATVYRTLTKLANQGVLKRFTGDGSGAFAADRALSVPQQIEAAKARVRAKNGGGKYIAYFQNLRTPTAASRAWRRCSRRRSRRRMWSRSRSPRGRTVCRMKPLRSCGG